ncbi:unnamed protein product [Soboliphyme baturini]|uniref:Not1 domain-containing protein n=1 Tax=Soboliphyme baturini TaxID=241478 RepID=A0A183IWX4_9BILA|nr:unnamed protein product [Soboliphyme baturini]
MTCRFVTAPYDAHAVELFDFECFLVSNFADFALEPEENKMRIAAHNMVRSLTAGMAMITCRDPLQFNVQGYLKQAFASALRGYTTEQQRMMEEASQIIAEDNIELAQCYIVKSAAEKALLEIDKRLAHEFEMRRVARAENRQYYDTQMLKIQEERMPPFIRQHVGSITPSQLSVYEEFVRNVPGFKQAISDDLNVPFQTRPWPGGPPIEESELLFQHMLHEVESRLQLAIPSAQPTSGCQALINIREALAIASQNPRDTVSAQGLVQKLVEIILESYIPRSEVEWSTCLRDIFLAAIKGLIQIFGSSWVQKQVTKVLMECRRDCRFNVDAVDILIRSQLVNMVTYDLQLAQSMESGMNYPAVHFAQQLVRLYFVEERGFGVISEPDLSNTIEVLSRIANSQSAAVHEGRNNNLLEMLRALPSDSMFAAAALGPSVASSTAVNNIGRNPLDFSGGYSPATLTTMGAVNHPQAQLTQQTSFLSSNLISPQAGINHAREFCGDDPPGLHEKAEALLRDWVGMFHSPAAQRDQAKAFAAFVTQMHQNGILKSDDMITRFFRNCTEMCVDLCHRFLSDSSLNLTICRTRCFHTLDAYVHLIALLVRNSGEGIYLTKLNLLNKVLGIITGVLLLDQDVRRTDFHPLPFHRILLMLFIELTGASDPLLDPINYQILSTFCNVLHLLRPRKAPCFTYSWMDIIGHRTFLNRLLFIQPPKAWSLYAQLVLDHLHFLSPFLRNLEFQKPVTLVYKGTLRILLVLLHDFPELLCDYHYALCETIPPNCVQLRNLVLSAYPRNMRLPDPFLPSLQVDQLAEISSSPRINVNLAQCIQPLSLKNDLDAYLKNRAPVNFLSELRSKLQYSNEPGRKYDFPLMNAVVLYVGIQAIQAIQSKDQRPNITTIAHTAHMDIFQNLAVDLDTEGKLLNNLILDFLYISCRRYLFFNAIANHLRYPNSHTHYFSCTILYLFAEANSEAIQEQITRILFERLVALRPHPWGLLITFIELIKNPVFKFWSHQFVRCAPEIEKLFESVARSCTAKNLAENS